MRLWIPLLVGVVACALAVCAIRAEAPDGEKAPGPPPGDRGERPERPPDGPWDPARAHPLMQALDADGNGELSAEEMAAAPQALKKLDKSGDGKLGRDELRPAPPGRGERVGPGGMPPFGPGGMGPRGPASQASLEAPPTSKDDEEARVLKVLEDIPRKQGWRANVPSTDGRLLRLLAEAIGAKHAVEIGTSNGLSSIWLALALRKTGGKLTTFEIDPATAALARKNFEAAGVADLITLVEGDAHRTVAQLKGPIDLVFIDADKEGYLDYFRKTLPLVRPGGLVLAHNMQPGRANPDFLKAITTSPDVETLFYAQGGGMSVTLKKR